ncbi:Protein nen4 [Castilleja foliolosa]|uniref:Protein nen4 n=1 Tax=Castilleja foliolosa TaxID=1961234 RepID=A0ABD3BPG9_9LAMI
MVTRLISRAREIRAAHGITREAISNAPSFHEVANKIFDVLNGRIWAGHNIQRFDCVRIKEAFAKINRPAPTPAGMIDSLGVLTQKFGRRAGNMKMATLADYFGLGQQKHRSLDDVRMNLEVLKHCATVLLLESSLPTSVLNGQCHSNSSITTRSKSLLLQANNPENKPSTILRGRSNSRDERGRKSPPSSASHQRAVPYARESLGKWTNKKTKRV